MQTIKSFVLVLVLIIMLTLTGCAEQRKATTTEPKISLDYSPEYAPVLTAKTSVTVSQARAYRDGDEFVISGRVKRLHEIHMPGHVDLAICAPDGDVFIQETTRVPSLNSKRKGFLELPFRFRLQTIPPDGSRVKLQYHAPASKDKELGCVKS